MAAPQPDRPARDRWAKVDTGKRAENNSHIYNSIGDLYGEVGYNFQSAQSTVRKCLRDSFRDKHKDVLDIYQHKGTWRFNKPDGKSQQEYIDFLDTVRDLFYDCLAVRRCVNKSPVLADGEGNDGAAEGDGGGLVGDDGPGDDAPGYVSGGDDQPLGVA